MADTDEAAAAGQEQVQATPTRQRSEDVIVDIIAKLFTIGLFGGIFGTAIPPVRSFFFAHWVLVTSIAAVVVLIVVLYGPVREAIQRNVRTKVGAVIVSLGLLTMAEAGIGLLPPRYQILALRSVFVFTVCLIPGILYYLFITTRRDSLLNEFLGNLQRLGLLLPVRDESGSEFRFRVLTYLQKFEAAYGPIDAPIADALLKEPATSIEAVVLAAARDGKSGRSLASILTPEARAPLVICTVLMALGWTVSLPPWHDVLPPAPLRDQPVEWMKALYPDRSAVYYAFLGAYFFGIQMLFRRFILKDLRANAYVAISIRIVLAVIGTWVLLEVSHGMWAGGFAFDDPKMLVVAFVVGFFPPVVWQFIQALFKKSIGGFVLPSVEAKLPLNELDGLTIWHEARLQEEDIENVPNMATASIVDLMLNTRFSPERIIDWVDQAILVTYVGNDQDDAKTALAFRSTLRALGIRTASAFVAAYRWAEKGSDFDRILVVHDHSAVRTIVQAVQTNRNLGLINRWRGLTSIDWDELTAAGPASLSGVR